MKKIHIFYAVFCAIAAAGSLYFINTPHKTHADAGDMRGVFLKGKITGVQGKNFDVKISSDGKTVRAELNDFYLHDDYKKNDTVNLYVSESDDGGKKYDIADFYHLNGLIAVFAVFCALSVLIAGKRGFFSIISVLLSLFFFYAVVLGAAKTGFPMIPAGLLYVFLITIITIPLIHGFNGKSMSAIIAVNAGYIIGFAVNFLFTALAKIGSTPSEEFRTLAIQFPEINIREILIISLFLGAVGALIDVAVTICSAVFEGMKEHQNLTFKKTYRLGMNVGKDILGSMINTLLIAYLAASMPFLVMMTLSGYSDMAEFFNYDFVALELARIFIGAASIILLIPVTSVIAAYFVIKPKIYDAKRNSFGPA